MSSLPARPSAAVSSPRCLVVEPEGLLRANLVGRLGDLGLRVLVAASDAEARQALRDTTVDWMLLAEDLPDGSGAALLEELGGDRPHTVTLVAGIGPEKSAQRALLAGADGYLARDASDEDLVRTLGFQASKLLRRTSRSPGLRSVSVPTQVRSTLSEGPVAGTPYQVAVREQAEAGRWNPRAFVFTATPQAAPFELLVLACEVVSPCADPKRTSDFLESWLRMVATGVNGGTAPALLSRLRRTLEDQARITGIEVGATMLRLDPVTRTAEVAGTGCPPVILLQGRTPAGLLDTRGGFLGARSPRTIPNHLVHLERGDRLVLYTRGLLDAGAPTRPPPGLRRLSAWAQAGRRYPTELAADAFLDRAQAWAQGSLARQSLCTVIDFPEL